MQAVEVVVPTLEGVAHSMSVVEAAAFVAFGAVAFVAAGPQGSAAGALPVHQQGRTRAMTERADSPPVQAPWPMALVKGQNLAEAVLATGPDERRQAGRPLRRGVAGRAALVWPWHAESLVGRALLHLSLRRQLPRA